jgi:hypothetical protein
VHAPFASVTTISSPGWKDEAMARASCCRRKVVEPPITTSSGRAAPIMAALAAVASATLRAASAEGP